MSSSATKALEKLEQKKRRENEIKKIQKEREEAAKNSCCGGGGGGKERKEIDSDYNSSDEEVELRDEDSSDEDDDYDNHGAIKVGRKRVSLGSKKDKLVLASNRCRSSFCVYSCLSLCSPSWTNSSSFLNRVDRTHIRTYERRNNRNGTSRSKRITRTLIQRN